MQRFGINDALSVQGFCSFEFAHFFNCAFYFVRLFEKSFSDSYSKLTFLMTNSNIVSVYELFIKTCSVFSSDNVIQFFLYFLISSREDWNASTTIQKWDCMRFFPSFFVIIWIYNFWIQCFPSEFKSIWFWFSLKSYFIVLQRGNANDNKRQWENTNKWNN